MKSGPITEDRGSRPALQSVPYESLSLNQDDTRIPARTTTFGGPSGYRTKAQRPDDQGMWDGHGDSFSPRPATSNIASTPSSASYFNYSRSQSSLSTGAGDKQSVSVKPPTQPSNNNSYKPVKTRLNLRNPMSLLIRRRSGQTIENLSDESLISHRSQIIPAMTLPDDYDPRIRGKGVHDFSAPRQRRNFSYNDAYSDLTGPAGRTTALESDKDRLNTRTDGFDGKNSSGDYSPPKIEREHTPVFREHFDDDTSFEASQAAIRAETLANHDFLSRVSIPPPPARSPPPPPPIAKDSPPPVSHQPVLPAPIDTGLEFYESSTLSPVQESISPTSPKSPEQTPKKKKSTKTPPSTRSRATSVTDPSFIPAGLPAHLTSRASRFSFQISGNDDAQEKLLEERHKQKAAANAFKQARNSTNTLEDEYDEDMYDYNMDDDGFEEPIPMMGDEDDYNAMGTFTPGISAFDFSSIGLQLNNPLSPISMTGEALGTPLDVEGNAIGFAFSDSIPSKMHPSFAGNDTSDSGYSGPDVRGLGLVDFGSGPTGDHSRLTPAATPDDTDRLSGTTTFVDDDGTGDDLYFDDGMIEDPDQQSEEKFDEAVFDDPSHHLYARPAPEAKLNTQSQDIPSSVPPDASIVQISDKNHDTENKLPDHVDQTESALIHQTSKTHQSSSPNFESLQKYHSALADAANKAEADGRFRRHDSIDTGRNSSADDNDDEVASHGSHPSLIPDDSRYSRETSAFPSDFGTSSGFIEEDYDYSDYDSALEDDTMIAEANAEALANDYDGFYGQEFGFYASAQGEAQFANGGYFGASSIGRSISGRNAVREPNLTPITERSEYSTRNSYISLNHFGNSQQALPSPGIAQLARMSPYGFPDDDPDLSLSQLIKLRKGAFGGSNGSLGSSAGTSPRNSSPIAFQYYSRGASPITHLGMNAGEYDNGGPALEDVHDGGDEEDDDEALDAINAIDEEEEEDEDNENYEEDDEDENTTTNRESPTLTATNYASMADPASTLDEKPLPPLPIPPPLNLSTSFFHLVEQPTSPAPTSASAPRRQSLGLISPISTTSPMTPGGGRKAHSRKGSAADSVTYVREQDESGGDRWVLERRRTADTGELELIGREIVEGGRI